MRSILVWPDTHIDRHHRKAVENLLLFVREYQPDEIVNIGDFVDCVAPARWSRGSAEEYAPTLQKEMDEARSILTATREVFDGPYRLLEGNHERRIRDYLKKYAPALASLRALTLSELLALDEHGVTLERQPYKIAPGWVAIHGDRIGSKAGESALKMMTALGHSVVQGHSHRAGIIPVTTDKTRFAMEVGHVSDIRKQTYLPLGQANWQMGFGILHISGSKVHPQLVFMQPDGSFMVDGINFP